MLSNFCLLLSLLLIFGKEIESSIREPHEAYIVKLEKENEALKQELNLLRSNDQTSRGLCLGWQYEMCNCIGEYLCWFFIPISFSFKISVIECECYAEGSYGESCDVDGKCHCKPPFTGDKCDQSRTKFLIAASSKKTKTEIIDPLIDNFTCQDKIKPFPFTLWAPSGGVIGAKTPFICGGQKTKDSSLNPNCYTLDQDTGEWKIDAKATLKTPRSHAASVILGNKLVMLGGLHKIGYGLGPTNSIEVLTPGQISQELDVILPDALSRLCAVPWDEDTFFVIGGRVGKGDSRAETYIINIKTSKIIDGPKLKTPRYNHACQELQIEGRNYVVVVGGYRFPNVLKSTEVLDKGNLEQGWISGDDLKRAGLRTFQMVGDGQGSLYAMGGYDVNGGNGKSNIYKYQCNGDINTCVWIKIDAPAPFRGEFVALPITNELAQNLCQ